MACMCGDICCPSCGPAQSNSRCPICRDWVSEGCEHFDEETGELKPEFVAQAEEIAKAEAADYEAYFNDLQDPRD